MECVCGCVGGGKYKNKPSVNHLHKQITNTCNTNNQALNCQLKHFKYTIHDDHDGLAATSKANKILQQTTLDQYAWNASNVA